MKKFARAPEDFLEILQNLDCIIPLNQRGYAWEPERVNDFLYDCLSERKLGRENHFMGSALLASEFDEDLRREVWTLEDGQQRITTALLLVKSIEEKLQDYSPVVKKVIDECKESKRSPKQDECIQSIFNALELGTEVGSILAKAEIVQNWLDEVIGALKNLYQIPGTPIDTRIQIRESNIKSAFEAVMIPSAKASKPSSKVSENYGRIKRHFKDLIDNSFTEKRSYDVSVVGMLADDKLVIKDMAFRTLTKELEQNLFIFQAFLFGCSCCGDEVRSDEASSEEEGKFPRDEDLTRLVQTQKQLLHEIVAMNNLFACLETAKIVLVALERGSMNAMTVFLTSNSRGQGLVTFDKTKAIAIRHHSAERSVYSEKWLRAISACYELGVTNKEDQIIKSAFIGFVKGSSLRGAQQLKKAECNAWFEKWARQETAQSNNAVVQKTSRAFAAFWPTYFRMASAFYSQKSREGLLLDLGATPYEAEWIEAYCLRFQTFDRTEVVSDLAVAILLHYDWKDVAAIFATLEIAVTRIYIFENSRVDFHKPAWEEISGYILHGGVPANELISYIVKLTLSVAPLTQIKEKLDNKSSVNFKHWELTSTGWGERQFKYVMYELWRMVNSTTWPKDVSRNINGADPEIEHVLPAQRNKKSGRNLSILQRFNNLHKSWQKQFVSAKKPSEVWYRDIHDLGNLTLVPKKPNLQMGNKPFADKLIVLKKIAKSDNFNKKMVSIAKTKWELVQRDKWRAQLIKWMLLRWSFSKNSMNSVLITDVKARAGKKWPRSIKDVISSSSKGASDFDHLSDNYFEKIRDNWKENCGTLDVKSERMFK